jgi:hypothetical protein
LFSERLLGLQTLSALSHGEPLTYCLVCIARRRTKAFPLEWDGKSVRSCYWPHKQTFRRSITHQLCICVAPEQDIGCCNITCLKSQLSDVLSTTFLKGKSHICCVVPSVLTVLFMGFLPCFSDHHKTHCN